MGIFDFLKRKPATDLPETWEKAQEQHGNSYTGRGFNSIYHPIMFASSYERDEFVGSRMEAQREDYTISPEWYTASQYLHKLWRDSLDIDSDKIKNPRMFFEKIEEIESLLASNKKFKFKRFYPEKELSIYLSRKEDIVNAFIDRSFTAEVRKALELKTKKGRVDRMEHWFLTMRFYKNFMPEGSKQKLEAVYIEWLKSFNALEGE